MGRSPLTRPTSIAVAVAVVLTASTATAVWRTGRSEHEVRGARGSGRSIPETPPPSPPATAVSPVPFSPALAATLDAVWRAAPGGCAVVSSGGASLYEANPDAAVVPASLAKLLTATAALDILGVDDRFTTRVHGDLAADGVVLGDLWIVGGGDPVLGTDAWAARQGAGGRLHTSLDTLADRVVGSGVRRIAGRVTGDDSRYDRQRTVASWPARLVTDGEVGPLSALVANDGFRVWGHPGIPFADPAAGTAQLFGDLLRQRGVAVGGDATSGTAPTGVELATVSSPPVGDLVSEMLRDSDNGTAELLVKETGLRRYGEGSTEAGVRAIAGVLATRRLPTGNAVIADGSGLSATARVTCRLLATLLDGAEPMLAERLAVAGEAGTLRNRFGGTAVAGRVRAKTGSLDGMSGLAGFADPLEGRRLVFSYIVTGLADPVLIPSVQDPFVAALVTTGS